MNGNLSLRRNANNGTGTLTIDINGPAPGTNYDQLNVTGAVNLNSNGSSPYSLTVNGSVTSGTQYVIINNDGADAVTGTFSGKSQGSTFAVGNRNVTISYTGGDGNDVVLTALVTTRTWDGQKDDGTASANANWMTKENWVGDVAPQASDSLVFPQNAGRKLNFNDFPNGTMFSSIIFSGGGYQLRSANSNSNNIDLTAGITDNNASNNSADNNSIYTLAIGGAGGVTKNGAGQLGLLVSNNTYTGVTTINAGSLHITATQPSSPVNITGGTLTGSGVTGAITANSGTVAPGFSLRAHGAVIFNSAATYSVSFITTDDVLALTKLSVTGTVNLGNSTLNATYDSAPAMGSAFVIVENDDADPVTGTFSGLAEGANFTISRADGTVPLIFRISYRGGSGNDVTLTRVAPPTFSVDDVSINEGNSGQNNATFTVRRSEAIANASATVNYATTDGTATGMASPPESRDYVSISGTLTFNAGEAAKTINVPIFGDIVNEADETFFVTLSNPSNATIGDGQGVGTIRNDDQNTIVQFGAAAFSITEASTGVPVTVTRTGDTSGASTVDYTSSDIAGLINCNVINGIASSRCDYATSIGTLRFAAGETSKIISIPIVDDAYAEGNESFTITLSGATGVALGSPDSATVTINDNETVNGPNPIDQTPFFVRQQYVDFLGREPDPPGFAAWQAIINNCPPNDTTCDRIHVSSAFFRSAEFQERGYFVYRFYPVAFGRKPEYVEFIPDLARVSGFLTDTQLEAAKLALINDLMARPAFVTKHNGLSNTHYVDTLLATAGVNHGTRDFWIAALGNGTKTRADVLREIAESTEVYNKYYNQAFVVMQYFGYLRRDPDALYLDWIQVLDTTNNFRTMVNGFMNSPGISLPLRTVSNIADCQLAIADWLCTKVARIETVKQTNSEPVRDNIAVN